MNFNTMHLMGILLLVTATTAFAMGNPGTSGCNSGNGSATGFWIYNSTQSDVYFMADPSNSSRVGSVCVNDYSGGSGTALPMGQVSYISANGWAGIGWKYDDSVYCYVGSGESSNTQAKLTILMSFNQKTVSEGIGDLATITTQYGFHTEKQEGCVGEADPGCTWICVEDDNNGNLSVQASSAYISQSGNQINVIAVPPPPPPLNPHIHIHGCNLPICPSS